MEAGENLVEVTDVTPKYAGRHVISATFNSRQVTGITGEVVMEVARADDWQISEVLWLSNQRSGSFTPSDIVLYFQFLCVF